MHKSWLKKIVDEKWFTANGVIGFWPANSNNRDTVTLQTKKGEVNLGIASPTNEKSCWTTQLIPWPILYTQQLTLSEVRHDYMGAFAVTIHGAQQRIEQFACRS